MRQRRMWGAAAIRFGVGLSALLLAACGADEACELCLDGDTQQGGGDLTGSDAVGGDQDGPGGDQTPPAGDAEVGPCLRAPSLDPDPQRWVVISHPFSPSSSTYEVLSLSPAGQLTATGTTFEMGRSVFSRIYFTPDGQVVLAVQDDGTLGVFVLDATGLATVLHAAYDGGAAPFYAQDLLVHPDGNQVLIVDGNWRNNGGGLYRVTLGCDGQPTSHGRLVESKLGAALRWVPGQPGRAFYAATDVADSGAGRQGHLLELGAGDSGAVARLASAAAFGDDEFWLSAAAVTADGRHALLGDNNEFYDDPHNRRVAVLALDGASLGPRQLIGPPSHPLLDPVDLLPSPFDDLVLVVSGYGDAVLLLGYDPLDAVAPFSDLGEMSYSGPAPALPGMGVMLERGSLLGRVLLSENLAVRQLQFDGAGGVDDLGRFVTGAGNAAIVGAIGVTP